jgi:hypothetical protein
MRLKAVPDDVKADDWIEREVGRELIDRIEVAGPELIRWVRAENSGLQIQGGIRF